jgi:hypothetical protein
VQIHVRPRSDLITRTIEGEVVILDRTAGQVHQLNPTASCIWESCDGTRTAAEIAVRLAERFDDTPGNLLSDVIGILKQLEQRGLLVTNGTSAEQTDERR